MKALRLFCKLTFGTSQETLNYTRLWNKYINKGRIADKFDWLEVGK